MKKKIAQRKERSQGGQTLLEFALVAPLLIFFILALVDFGIAIDRKLVLDHAVREGARFASVGGDALNGNPADVTAVREYMEGQSQGMVDPGAVDGENGYTEVCYDNDGGVQVGITYTHDFVTGFTAIFDLGIPNIRMDVDAAARVEQTVTGIPPCV